MSVTFYDPADPPRFNSENFEEKGIWLNFSNANGLTMLYYMGLEAKDYGEMDGADFRRCVHRGIETVKLLNIPQKIYFLDRFDQMMGMFINSKVVKWD